MSTDFRALCAELLKAVDDCDDYTLTEGATVARARAALVEPVGEPAPPAAGEVAELVAWLRLTGEGQPRLSSEGYARLTRAADLLEQRHPVPVPVAERLPGAEDCDAEERCWLLAPRWILPPSELTHWLPATALPLPSGGGAAMSDTNRPPLWRTMEMSTGACAEWQHIILALRFGHRNSEVNP